MPKYHLSKDGSPGLCKAMVLCPLGGDDAHGNFANAQEASAWAEKKLNEEYSGFFGQKALNKRSEAYELDRSEAKASSFESRANVRKKVRSAERWEAAARAVKSLSSLPENTKKLISDSFKSGFRGRQKSPSRAKAEVSVITAMANANEAFVNMAKASHDSKAAATYVNSNGYSSKLGPDAAGAMRDYDKIQSELSELRATVMNDPGIAAEDKEEFYSSLSEDLNGEAQDLADTLKASHNIDARELSSKNLQKVGPRERAAIVKARQEIKALTKIYYDSKEQSGGTRSRSNSLSGVLAENFENSSTSSAAYSKLSKRLDEYNDTYHGKYLGVKAISPIGLSTFSKDDDF